MDWYHLSVLLSDLFQNGVGDLLDSFPQSLNIQNDIAAGNIPAVLLVVYKCFDGVA